MKVDDKEDLRKNTERKNTERKNCLNCSDRVVGCHSTCDIYKKNKKEIDYKREKRQKCLQSEIMLYIYESKK